MTVKTKLTLGIGLLFGLITFLIIVASVNISALKGDSENVLTANYKSLEYGHNMLSALDKQPKERINILRRQIGLQLKNISEPGELSVSESIQNQVDKLQLNPNDSIICTSIRNSVYRILQMNMQAIERKSTVAKITAEKAIVWLAISGTMCFVIAFALLLNLPAYIANPIRKLTESIKQIAEKNYSERLHFTGGSEFGSLAKSFNIMATKLEEYNNSNLARITMEKQRIETLINNMHDPVIGLDSDLKIIFANTEALLISGLKGEEVIGKSAKEVSVTNDLIRTLIRDISVSMPEQAQVASPIKIYAGNKESYFEKEAFPIRITPVAEEDEQLVGYVIFLRNITSYKELDEAKTNFIGTVSHEFKTPIASIKMSLQLLENDQIGVLNTEQHQLVESISDDVGRLLKITGELLNMSQVESGNIQLKIETVGIRDVIDYALNANKTAAEAKNIRIDTAFPVDPVELKIDREKTCWILNNLVSNAIRYSYEYSSVVVSVDQDSDFVKISVTDSGQGIAPEYQGKIFNRYFRVPGSTKDGTGLGLAISKEFVEAQGGKILVDSTYGKGSIFTLMLRSVVDRLPSEIMDT